MELASLEPVSEERTQQLKLFSLPDPLTERFGAVFFKNLPSEPGVYFMKNAERKIIYIGQSSDLKARIGSYRHVTPERHPRRTLRMVAKIALIEWQICATALEAIELERALLIEHRPKFNRAGVWRGEPWWLNVDAADGKLVLELKREKGGLGPLPSAFRYVLGSLARCLYRSAFPNLQISEYPHGLFRPALPLDLVLTVPDAEELSVQIIAYAQGDPGSISTRLELLSLGSSEAEREFWQEEIKSGMKWAEKAKSDRARPAST
jgi:predicted GIY-YIG superfamily endonuclease